MFKFPARRLDRFWRRHAIDLYTYERDRFVRINQYMLLNKFCVLNNIYSVFPKGQVLKCQSHTTIDNGLIGGVTR